MINLFNWDDRMWVIAYRGRSMSCTRYECSRAPRRGEYYCLNPFSLHWAAVGGGHILCLACVEELSKRDDFEILHESDHWNDYEDAFE